MAFNTPKNVFKSLRKLPVQKRVALAGSPEGQSLLMALTPTDFAALFPRYYQQRLPDAGGFYQALTKKSQEEQSSILNRIEQMAASAEKKSGEMYDWAKNYVREKTGGAKPLPQLTKEQSAAYDAIKKGPVDVSSDQGKIFAGLTKDKLDSIGIEKVTENGKTIFRYSAPVVTREEAESRLKSSAVSGTGMNRSVYNAFVAAGFSPQQAKALTAEVGRENNFNPNLIYGTHAEPGGSSTARGRENIGMFSWGDPKRHAEFIKFMRENGGYDENGKLKRDQATLVLQAKFVRQEMTSYNSQSKEFLANRDVNRDEGGKLLASYIGWDITGTHGLPGGPGAASEHIARRNRYYADIDAASGKPIVPEGPNGQYSDKQIVEITEQIKTEKDTARRQQLANVLEKAGVTPSATVTYGETRDMEAEVDFRHSQSKCGIGTRHLAGKMFGDKYFNNGLGGPASSLSRGNDYFEKSGYFKGGNGVSAEQLRDKAYRDSLPIGTVVAVGGGNAKGEGHVQIKIGPNSWASDFPQGDRVLTTRRDGREYSGYKVFMPNEAGMKRLDQMGFKQNVQDTQVATLAQEAQVAAVSSNVSDADTKSADVQPQTIIETPGPGVKQESKVVQPEPTVEPTKPAAAPKPQPVQYKFNEKAFLQEVRAKNFGASLVSDDYIMGETVKGFDATPGVKYNRKTGMITIEDPKSPAIQKVIADMKANNLDSNAFLAKQEQKKEDKPKVEAKQDVKPVPEAPKKEEPKPPVEQKKEEPKPTQASAPTPAPAAPTKPTADVKPPEAPKKVPGAALGGSFNIPDGGFEAYNINVAKGDNKIAIDPKTNKPLFTFGGHEQLNYDPSQNRVDITPKQKAGPLGPGEDNFANQLNSLRDQMTTGFEQMAKPSPTVDTKSKTNERDDNTGMVRELLNMTRQPYQNPTFVRAMSRTRFQETGDATNDYHYSQGNK